MDRLKYIDELIEEFKNSWDIKRLIHLRIELVKEATIASEERIEEVKYQVKAWSDELDAYIQSRSNGKIFKQNIMIPLLGLRTLIETVEKTGRS